VHRLRQRVEHVVARDIRIGYEQPTDDATQRVIRQCRATGAASVKRVEDGVLAAAKGYSCQKVVVGRGHNVAAVGG
jgi:hypothetical protein